MSCYSMNKRSIVISGKTANVDKDSGKNKVRLTVGPGGYW